MLDIDGSGFDLPVIGSHEVGTDVADEAAGTAP